LEEENINTDKLVWAAFLVVILTMPIIIFLDFQWWIKRVKKWFFEKELEKGRTTKTYKEAKEIFILPRLNLTDNLSLFLCNFYGIMMY